QQLQLGDWHASLHTVRVLREEYPNDTALPIFEDEAARKLAHHELWHDRIKEHRRYTGLLRGIRLLVTLLLCGGFFFGGWHLYRIAQQGKAAATTQQELLAAAEHAMQEYDYRTAVDLYRQLLALAPEHADAANGLDRAIAQRVLENEYAAGVAALDQGLLSQAQTILTQLDQKAPNYRDTQALLIQIATAQATPPPMNATKTGAPSPVSQPIATAEPNVLHAYSGQIAFRSRRNGDSAYYFMQADGSQQQPAPDTLRAELEALYQRQQWNRERTVQVYTAGAPERTDSNLYMRQLRATNTEPVISMLTDFPGNEAEAVWSPQGDVIAFVANHTGNEEIWTLAIQAQVAQQLTNNDWAWDKHPSWSPDGSQLVFYSNRSGVRQVWRMNADGSNPQNLSNSQYEEWDPIWIP
ncbi:MAG: PD40 domain-containing protein, partial [Caldilineaceae bacterium]|nr:PD40 domain-containing protein [Caldilineaceae bacterium]